MADYKVSEDVAQTQLDAMEAEYGDVDPTSAEIIFRAIRSGLVDFDESEGVTTYHLQRPPESEGFDTSTVSLEEPGAEEMRKISQGSNMTANKNGEITIDPSVSTTQALNMVIHLGKWPSNLAKKIKRRDIKNLEALSAFFA